VAACVIYKCLLHWRSFEVERTSVFDRIIQTIASSVEVTLYLGLPVCYLRLSAFAWSISEIPKICY